MMPRAGSQCESGAEAASRRLAPATHELNPRGSRRLIPSHPDQRPVHPMKVLLFLLGIVSSILIVSQMVMGLLIRNGQAEPWLRTAHFHSGSLMVLVSLAYIALSLSTLASGPKREAR